MSLWVKVILGIVKHPGDGGVDPEQRGGNAVALGSTLATVGCTFFLNASLRFLPGGQLFQGRRVGIWNLKTRAVRNKWRTPLGKVHVKSTYRGPKHALP
ncbi:hypothetical protein NC796_17165 [Aliifodinibius sp. S!AR15-10]|nr:hypothetical protein [Aliifodinibius sp. S!AR15-10]